MSSTSTTDPLGIERAAGSKPQIRDRPIWGELEAQKSSLQGMQATFPKHSNMLSVIPEARPSSLATLSMSPGQHTGLSRALVNINVPKTATQAAQCQRPLCTENQKADCFRTLPLSSWTGARSLLGGRHDGNTEEEDAQAEHGKQKGMNRGGVFSPTLVEPLALRQCS